VRDDIRPIREEPQISNPFDDHARIELLEQRVADLEATNERVASQSQRVGQLQQDLKTASWWRRGRVRHELSVAIRDWTDMVHVQESLWRQVERGYRR
jgi:hypothetical protein